MISFLQGLLKGLLRCTMPGERRVLVERPCGDKTSELNLVACRFGRKVQRLPRSFLARNDAAAIPLPAHTAPAAPILKTSPPKFWVWHQ